MFDYFFGQLEKELKNKLPGEESQKRMAPSLRNYNLKIIPKANRSSKRGSVLILLYPYNKKIHTIFIKRPYYEGVHSGQVCFPGGKFEKSDKNLFFTALREAKEEIGIDPGKITVLGGLTPLFIPISNFLVFPVVGRTDSRPKFTPNAEEVEKTIEIGLERLADPAKISTETIHVDNVVIESPYYNAKGHHIWGATAMILSEFLEIAGKVKYDGIL